MFVKELGKEITLSEYVKIRLANKGFEWNGWNDLKTMEPAKRMPFMRLTNLDFINPEDFSLEDWNEALKALFPLMTKSLTKKDAHKILISCLESNKKGCT